MFPIAAFVQRFHEVLDELDDCAESSPDPEAMEELNANLEDALFLLECTREDDEDWREEVSDALSEIRDLAEAYGELIPGEPALERLQMALALASGALKG